MKKMNRITALVVAGIISCTSPMMVMASDSSSVMSQAEEILKDNEIESLASDPDKVGDIIVYVKGLFDSNQISDDEISQGIDEAADHYGVTLSEDDKNSLVNIISKFRGIDISDDQIKGYVSDAYSTLKDMGVTKSDVKNIFELHLYQFVITFYEDAFNFLLGLLQQFEPLHCFIGGLQKVCIRDGFQQIIEGVDPIPVYGILVESGGENDTGMCIYHSGEFQAVEFGHLDIEKKKVDTFVRQVAHRLHCTGVFAGKFQKRGFVDVALQQVQSQRFIVYDCALQIHVVSN